MELHQLTKHCYWSDPVSYGDRPSLGLSPGWRPPWQWTPATARATASGSFGRRKGWGFPRCGGRP